MFEEGDKKAFSALNVFKFWRKNRNEFPDLSKLARYMLCVPSTSATSETLFSLG